MKYWRHPSTTLACAALLLTLSGCGTFSSSHPWIHTQPERNLAADSSACSSSAQELSLTERGGAPATIEEQQHFHIVRQRHFDRCMQENGWRRSRQ